MIKLAGHRGLPAQYPENSLIGIQAAIDGGAEGIECDVQLSRDGTPFILHDPDLARVAGLDLSISSLCDDALRTVKLHERQRFGERFLATPLSPLSDLVPIMQAHPDILFFVEIKSEIFAHVSRDFTMGAIHACLAAVQNQVVIISFDEELVRVARDNYGYRVGWVLSAYSAMSRRTAKQLQPDFLLCHDQKIGPQSLWPGPWLWFLYDIVDADVARELFARGATWLESWDVASLYQQLRVGV